jgi:DNA-binding response OmpR family regulator
MAARPSVVVVEDDATVRTVVADYLRADGNDVSTYSDGATALTALASGIPDVLVLDRMPPGLSGDDLCVEICRRSDAPVLSSLPSAASKTASAASSGGPTTT